MATTATLLAATPHMLRYKFDSSAEGGEVANLAQTTLIDDCIEGPLKNLLTSPLFEPSPGDGPVPNNWSNLHTDARMTIYVSGFGTTAVAGAFQFRVVSTVNTFSVAISDTGSVLVELQYENTLVR